MDGYINREDIYKAIQKADRHSTYMTHNGLIEALKIIANLPDVNVKFIKRGRWFLRGGNWCCSACNRKTLLTLESNIGGCKEYGTVKTDYCPNCGAEMNGEVQ